MEVGHFLTQFYMPPSGLGGSRQESVGRALQAVAKNNPEIADWVNMVGRGMRLGTGEDSITTAANLVPQSQAQVGFGGTAGAIGGGLAGLLFGGAAASDPQQSRLNASSRMRSTSTQIAREIAQIRSNPSMTPAQKRERIIRLRAQQREQNQETRSYLDSL